MERTLFRDGRRRVGRIHSRIISLLLLVFVIVALVMLVRSIRQRLIFGCVQGRSLGLDVLEERYAKGEIHRDEYLQKKRDLVG